MYANRGHETWIWIFEKYSNVNMNSQFGTSLTIKEGRKENGDDCKSVSKMWKSRAHVRRQFVLIAAIWLSSICVHWAKGRGAPGLGNLLHIRIQTNFNPIQNTLHIMRYKYNIIWIWYLIQVFIGKRIYFAWKNNLSTFSYAKIRYHISAPHLIYIKCLT